MKTKNFWLSALAVLLAFSLLWGFSENRDALALKTATENQNRRSLADFVSHLDGLETSVAKSRAAGTPLQQIFYLSQSWHQSETAVKDLSLLPAKEFGLDYLDQFLNQIGEFSRILTQQIAKGVSLDAGQEETLAAMHERLLEVNRKVQELSVNLQTEDIAWLDKDAPLWQSQKTAVPAAAEGEEAAAAEPSSIRSGLEQLDSSLQKLPPFSYSGQEDTHAVPKPLGLPQQTVNEDQAMAAALDFLRALGYPEPKLQLAGTSSGTFAGYVFTSEQISIDIAKQGGVVTLFRDERNLGLQQLSAEQAADKAMETLQALGWKSFVQTSVEDFGGYIQLDAVNTQQGVRIYPDKIRLAIGRDNGMIISYDATPYWLYHHERSLTPKIMPDEAQSKLSKSLAVKETRLAVISQPGYTESFCYEFRAGKDKEDFLVYVNALNGIEEKIQRIVITPRGEFLQ